MKRILGITLAFLMVWQVFPVYAEEDPKPEESAEIILEEAETELTDEEPAEITEETAEEPEEILIEEPAEEEPQEEITETEIPQETEVPEVTEELEETEAPEVTEPESEPEPVITLSDEEIQKKQRMAESPVLEELSQSIEGVDYVSGEVILLCDSQEYAEYTAQAYGGVLARYDGYTAVIHLPDDLSVYEAVSRGMDPETLLPAVDVNWLITLDDPEIAAEEKREALASAQALNIPQKTDWMYWIETLDNPDPFLENASYSAMETYCWQWYHDYIGTYAAWGVTTGSPEVKVAVIDSGVQEDHEELADRVTLRQVSDIPTAPSNGHGTHVAGIIAAELGNGKGGAGIAPEVSIYSYNIFRGNSAATADIASAILLAAEDQVWIMNMSFGTVSYSQTVQDAVTTAYEAGVTIISSIGNYGTNLKCYPAAYDHVIAVAATDRTGERAVYSGYGDWCDLAAPGSEITSSYYVDSTASGYRTQQGTSMSSPVVAGGAALYMSAFGYTSPDDMERILKNSTVKKNGEIGTGILSLDKLFGRKESAPQIAYDAETDTLTITAITEDDRAMIVYTLDGKNPSIKKKQVKNGLEYTGPVDLSGMPHGTILTVKAAVISGVGLIGDISSLQIMTSSPQISVANKKITSLKLENTAMTLKYAADNPETAQINVSEIVLEDGTVVTLDAYSPEDYQWYSGNDKVVTVDQDGMITAAGKGSAYVYLKLRFQNMVKTVRCKVTVKQLAEEIVVRGRAGILPGKTLTMKTTVLPSNTNNKKVTWSIAAVSDELYADKISISSKGVLKVGAVVAPETVIVVKAEAKDGSGVSGIYPVTVCTKASLVTITRFGETIKSAKLFTADLPETGTTENTLQVDGMVMTAHGESEVPPVWTTSKPKVAKVDANGKITAVGKGTATITCTAADGSGKKATLKVSVKVPTSGVFITVPAKNSNTSENLYSMAVGTTSQLKAVIGKVYGKPSVQTVQWHLEEAVINGYSVLDEVIYYNLVKISKTGKVTVSSKMLDTLGILNYQNGYIVVSATAKDGTEHYDEVRIYLRKKITSVTTSYKTSAGESIYDPNKSIAVSQNKTITVFADYDGRPQSVNVKTSDPNKCGARVDSIQRNGDGYRATIKITGGLTAGDANITITENGSGIKSVVRITTKEAQ